MPIRIVTGPPCAGKTTYVQQHRLPGEPVVDWDALTLALGAATRDTASDAISAVTRAAKSAAVGTILSTDSITDAWCIYSRATQKQLDWFLDNGAEIITIDPGQLTCLSRAWQMGRPKGVIDAINQYYEREQQAQEENENEKGDSRMKTKQMSMQIKSADTQAGTFEGYASVFGNRDSYGDIVHKGAFTETLKSYGEGGAGIPVYWAHNLDDPEMNIGQTLSAEEDEHGLKVHVQLDLDNPKAAYVHRLIKAGRVNTMSFTYSVTDGSYNAEAEAYNIKGCELFEISVVAVPANREAQIVAAKNAEQERHSAIETTVESLKARVSALETALAEQTTKSRGEDQQRDNSQTQRGSGEDQVSGKSRCDLVIKKAEAYLAKANH